MLPPKTAEKHFIKDTFKQTGFVVRDTGNLKKDFLILYYFLNFIQNEPNYVTHPHFPERIEK